MKYTDAGADSLAQQYDTETLRKYLFGDFSFGRIFDRQTINNAIARRRRITEKKTHQTNKQTSDDLPFFFANKYICLHRNDRY